MNTKTDLGEYMWGGYLAFLIETGAITNMTPRADVERIRAEFMLGLNADSARTLAPAS